MLAIATNTAGKRKEMIDKIVPYLTENFAENLSLLDLSNAIGISRFSLCRAYQRRYGVTPMAWLWTLRTLLAHEFIWREPRWMLTDVAFSCGFTSSAHFSRLYRKIFGFSPMYHRKRALNALAHRSKPVVQRTNLKMPVFEPSQIRKLAIDALGLLAAKYLKTGL